MANYTPFAKLPLETRRAIATGLGYTVYESGGFYNSQSNSFITELTPAKLSPAQQDAQASAQGYTKLTGTVYFNPSTGKYTTALLQGPSADYSNSQIDWAAGGVTAPASSAGFDSLSQAQKEVVARQLGYTVEPSFQFTSPTR
jgi:hypothetical protein